MASVNTEHMGLCVYCGKPAAITCKFCGGLVCRQHLSKYAGICIKCVGGRRIE